MSCFEQCVEAGWVEDGVLSQSLAQAQALWRLREDISETISRWTPYKNGDGNVHLNILKPDELSQEDFQHRCGEVSTGVFAAVRRHGGSISAEHGVGLLKKPYLGFTRSAAEIEIMRGIKRVFDPAGILNPGKLLDA